MREKWQVTETVLETRDLSAKGGDAERETVSVKLPSRDVYQGFLAHEAEGLREKRRKERRKRKKTEKKDIWHF